MNEPPTLTITSLSHDGRGIAHLDGKTIFVKDALPGDKVKIFYLNKHSTFDEAKILELIAPSKERVTPICPHFAICGGCSLQHMSSEAQILFKQNILREQLQHIAGIEITAQQLLPPLTAKPSGYRRKARLSVKYVNKKNKLLVGFHEKNGRYVADIDSCAILDPVIGFKLKELNTLIASLSIAKQIPQIEVACGDNVVSLVFRVLAEPNSEDLKKLKDFANKASALDPVVKAHDDIQLPGLVNKIAFKINQLEKEVKMTYKIYLQRQGVDSLELVAGNNELPLSYKTKNHKVEIFFNPTDFVQINSEINKKLVDQVLAFLDPKPQDQILDLFCGLGNFTLPLARQCQSIIGIEGDLALVERAKINAQKNGILNAKFYSADLTQDEKDLIWRNMKFDKILLDPPRTGALEVCQYLPTLGAKKIVYISCAPATLARDLKVLCQNGYNLVHIGVLDMFPHTKHVESIAILEK